LSHTTEQQLAQRAQRGDREALGELLERHRNMVFQMTLRILGNRDEALDATQEALLRVIRHLKSFRTDRPFAPWARRIAVRAALDQAGRSRHHPGAGEDPDTLGATGAGPGATASRLELRDKVEKALAALSPAQRAAFVCKEIQGLDTRQTARAMGCRRATVRWHLFEARKKLAARLAETGVEP
jgi:RNA polymerase sigma-70 factor, ECF subfamily